MVAFYKSKSFINHNIGILSVGYCRYLVFGKISVVIFFIFINPVWFNYGYSIAGCLKITVGCPFQRTKVSICKEDWPQKRDDQNLKDIFQNNDKLI